MKHVIVLVVLLLFELIGCSSISSNRNVAPTTDQAESRNAFSTSQVTDTGRDLSLPQALSVEFVSGPLRLPVSYYRFGPKIATGDLTGDGQPEMLLAMEGEKLTETTPENAFWRHPFVLSWDGETLGVLEAQWLGIPSYPQGVETYWKQGLPGAILVSDIDKDGINEVVVGTAPYRSADQRGALHVFQWDGHRFTSEFSDYCLGYVYRLDLVSPGNNQVVAVSTGRRPVTEIDAEDGVCPELPKGPGKPTSGLYILSAPRANEYQTELLVADDATTSLVVRSNNSPGISFVRLRGAPPGFVLDWSSAQVIQFGGQVSEVDLTLEVKPYVVHMEATDLDGDRTEEIVVLSATDAKGEHLFWQVFHFSQDRYALVYERPVVHSSSLRDSFVLGDADNDGRIEVLDDAGDIYSWIGNQLCYEGNLLEAMGEDVGYGLEWPSIEDIYKDGTMRIIFIRRYDELKKPCFDCIPWLYIVAMNSDMSDFECH